MMKKLRNHLCFFSRLSLSVSLTYTHTHTFSLSSMWIHCKNNNNNNKFIWTDLYSPSSSPFNPLTPHTHTRLCVCVFIIAADNCIFSSYRLTTKFLPNFDVSLIKIIVICDYLSLLRFVSHRLTETTTTRYILRWLLILVSFLSLINWNSSMVSEKES